jgi:acetylornithine deacetylase
MTEKQKVMREIENNRKEIVDFLKELIRKPSTVGREAEAQNLVLEKLKKMGLKIDVWWPEVSDLENSGATVLDPELRQIGYEGRPLVVGTLEGSRKGRGLILNGHVDVVSPEPLDKWTHDPWGGEEEEGSKIYGRGASDMKGGIAVMVMAVDSIIKAGIRLNGDIILESVIDEERFDGAGTLACILRGYRADAAIVLEPSNLDICVALAGVARFKITVSGRAAHACNKHEGVSAIDKIIKIYQAIQDLEIYRETHREHPLISHSQYKTVAPIVVGTMNAGRWSSTVPDKAELTCRSSVMPQESLEDVKGELGKQISHIAATDPWLRDHPPDIKMMSGFEGVEIGRGEPIVKTLEDSCLEVMRSKPRVRGLPGGADVRLLVNYANIPTVLFGPGFLEACHSPDEFTTIDQVLDATKIIALTILNWCK